jgi:hypothetical protein
MNKLVKAPLVMIAAVLLGIVFSSSGCRKKHDTIAKIYIRDHSNSLVSGAQVRVKGESTDPNNPSASTLDKTATTNSAGEATFNFNDVYQLGQAGVAVVNIYAEKDLMEGEGIMKVEQEVTSEETVFISQ